jgi:peptidoglycan hydrolase-like protein with peptidoglycan-binding domain
MKKLINKGKKFGFLALALLFIVGGAQIASAYTFSLTMRMGANGSEVFQLQKTLNTTTCKVALFGAGASGFETMYFGVKTDAAVRCFQAARGLGADGIVGPITRAALNNLVVVNPSSGTLCPNGNLLSNNCIDAGGSNPPENNSGLSGGAATLDFSTTTSNTEGTVGEGDTEKVLAFKAEADGGDAKLTNVKVVFQNDGYASSSESFTKYVDEVSIWMGDKEVGSADSADFSRDSTTPDTFTRTIALSNAIVREGDTETFFVAVKANSSIDSLDFDANWNVEADTARYTDSTGAILNESIGDNANFGFEDNSTSDDISLKSSSANPDDMTVKVEASDTSDEFLALAFKLDVDEDSSDVMVTSMPFTLTFTDLDTDADADSDTSDDSTSDSAAENAIDSVMVKVGSDEFEADLDSGSVVIANGDGTATYVVDFDDDEFTVDSGDVTEVKVYVTFNDQEDHYINGATLVVDLANEDIDAETSEDELDVDGSDQTGAELTLNTAVADVSSVSWVSSGGGAAAGSLDFFFTVAANDGDVDVTDDAVDAVDTLTATGSATIAAAVVTLVSGDASGTTDAYTVAEGDTATFRVRYAVAGTAGSAEVRITDIVGQPVADNKELSPTIFVE